MNRRKMLGLGLLPLFGLNRLGFGDVVNNIPLKESVPVAKPHLYTSKAEHSKAIQDAYRKILFTPVSHHPITFGTKNGTNFSNIVITGSSTNFININGNQPVHTSDIEYTIINSTDEDIRVRDIILETPDAFIHWDGTDQIIPAKTTTTGRCGVMVPVQTL